MEGNKIKHMEMIQGIITRMANNSFALKGWSVTLVSALFALSGKDANLIYSLVAFIPIIVFWFLDSYYLSQERKYRNLYNIVRKLNDDQVDFNMDTRDSNISTHNTKIIKCFKSPTIFWFYCPLCFVTVIIVTITLIIQFI